MSNHTNGRNPVTVGENPRRDGPLHNRLIVTGLLEKFRAEVEPLKKLIADMEALLDQFYEDDKHLGDGVKFTTEISLLRRMVLQKLAEMNERKANLLRVLMQFSEGEGEAQ